MQDLSRAALVLLGHGTTQNPESGANVIAHAAHLRSQAIFGDVREAFWKQEPHIHAVLSSLREKDVYLVPMFIGQGYFSQEVIPRKLGFPEFQGQNGPSVESRTLDLEGRIVRYCQPVGSHPHMVEVLLERAREVVARFPFPRPPKPLETTLFIAGHGTEQNANSRKNVDLKVEQIRARGIYADVHAIFLDQSPRIHSCYEMARTRNLVVVPFFMGDGLHVAEDIPTLLGEPERLVKQRLATGQPTWRNPTEKQGKLVWYSASVGSHPSITRVIVDCVRDFNADGA